MKATSLRRESLRRRLSIIRRDGLACGLDGLPAGGWPETQQALARLREDLPHTDLRSYLVRDLVAALYTVDHAGRYQRRTA